MENISFLITFNQSFGIQFVRQTFNKIQISITFERTDKVKFIRNGKDKNLSNNNRHTFY